MVKKVKCYQRDVIMLIALFSVLILSIWKSKYGFGGKDVSFYLDIPYRMIQGDQLFWDEWNLSQLHSFLIYPIMKIYMIVMGTTQGIMLNFRYIYLIVNYFIAICIYFKIRKFGYISIFISTVYFLYVPFNSAMLSYNTMSMMFGFLGILLIANTNKKRDYFVAGLCYSVATLCQPVLAIIFLIFFIVLIIYCKIKNSKILKNWLVFTSACIISALPVCVYTFGYVGIKKIIQALPGMIMDLGVEHGTEKDLIGIIRMLFGGLFPKTIYSFGNININTAYLMFIIYVILIVNFTIFIIKYLKKKSVFCSIWLEVGLCTVSSLICCLSVETNPINIFFFPFIFVGMMSYFLLKNDEIKRLLECSFIWGIVHSISFLTSNGGALVFAIAFFPMSMIAIISSYYVLIKERDSICNCTKRIFIVILLISLICISFIRVNGMFKDHNIGSMKNNITEGPAKGLVVNDDDYKLYNYYLQDIYQLKCNDKNLLLLTERTWAYLFTEIPLAQYSTYFPGINEKSLSILNEYYKINRAKVPDIVYIPNEILEMVSIEIIVEKLELESYTKERKNNGCVLYKTKNDIKY